MKRTRGILVAMAVVAALGCGDSGGTGAGGDAGPYLDAGDLGDAATEPDAFVPPLDAGLDGALDAGELDAGELDAGEVSDAGAPDGEPDAGPDCECSSGPCCDGCFFRPTTHRCAADVVYSSRCTRVSEACPGYHDRISEDFGDVYCPGDAATCTGAIDHLRTVSRPCWSSSTPFFCAGPDGDAACDHSCE